jgi:hypothetical protein
MEVLSFKLPVSGGSRIRLRTGSSGTSFIKKSETAGRAEAINARAGNGGGALKRDYRVRFEFAESLQRRRTFRRGPGLFLQAAARAKASLI